MATLDLDLDEQHVSYSSQMATNGRRFRLPAFFFLAHGVKAYLGIIFLGFGFGFILIFCKLVALLPLLSCFFSFKRLVQLSLLVICMARQDRSPTIIYDLRQIARTANESVSAASISITPSNSSILHYYNVFRACYTCLIWHRIPEEARFFPRRDFSMLRVRPKSLKLICGSSEDRGSLEAGDTLHT